MRKDVMTAQRFDSEIDRTNILVWEKERYLTQSYEKINAPYTNRTFQKSKLQHKSATKIFDYTTIADRSMIFDAACMVYITG